MRIFLSNLLPTNFNKKFFPEKKLEKIQIIHFHKRNNCIPKYSLWFFPINLSFSQKRYHNNVDPKNKVSAVYWSSAWRASWSAPPGAAPSWPRSPGPSATRGASCSPPSRTCWRGTWPGAPSRCGTRLARAVGSTRGTGGGPAARPLPKAARPSRSPFRRSSRRRRCFLHQIVVFISIKEKGVFGKWIFWFLKLFLSAFYLLNKNKEKEKFLKCFKELARDFHFLRIGEAVKGLVEFEVLSAGGKQFLVVLVILKRRILF